MTTHKIQRARAIVLASLLPLCGCMTTGEGSHRDNVFGEPEPQEKPGAKTQQPGLAGASAATPVPAPPIVMPHVAPAPTVDEELAFVRRQTAPGAAFDAAERQFVAQLPSGPPPGSVAEAALALGLIKTALNPLNAEVTTFQESDLGKPDSSAAAKRATSTPPLEQLCKEHSLNLPDALAENPLLSTAGVAKQVVSALRVGDNSAAFQAETLSSLKKQANLWNEVSGGIAPTPAAPLVGPLPGPAGPPALPADAATAAGAAAGAAPGVAPGPPAEAAGGDSALADAQALADRGDYEGAIKKAGSIAEANPARPQALEKVKDYSNLAVQELRRKAAAAFQSAMPVADPRTRAEYLRQAKGFLEEAVTKFPDATQLPTVKDNLRIIGRDLEKLEAETGATEKKG